MIGGFKMGFMASLGYSKMGMREVAESLSAMGYDAVSLPLSHFHRTMGILGSSPTSNTKEGEESHLDISEIVVQQDLVFVDEEKRADAIRFICDCIESFGRVGVTCINVFPRPRQWIEDPVVVGRDVKEGEAWDMLFEAFDLILPVS